MILPSPDNTYNEWFLEGQPTCIAQGPHHHSCEAPSLLVCSGGSGYGTGEEQASALKIAMDNGGVHPDCPGCTTNRNVAHSPTVCMTKKGNECRYECDDGYVPTGPMVCQENGVLTGGGCVVRVVDTETNEMTSPSPIPSPSNSPQPSVINPTQEDISHENWTEWRRAIDEEQTAEYQKLLGENICLYLLDLENHWQEIHLMPRKPLRFRLYDAARAGECAWFHEEVVSTAEERKHLIPVRGDKGPWPRILTPNLVHVSTSQGVMALSVDLQSGKGIDLYQALAERMSLAPSDFTIYLPNSVHPVDEGTLLSSYNIKLSDTLKAIIGQRVWTADRSKDTKFLFEKRAITDGDIGAIAP
jgi:hypothetical protein